MAMRLRKWAVAAVAGTATLGVVGAVQAQAPAGTAKVTASAGQMKPAAVVNGETISMAELEAVMNREGPKAVQVPEAELRQMRLAVLGQLIDEMLTMQYLKKTCPPADPAEVNKRMAEVAEGLKKQGKTVAQFAQEIGTTEAEMRAEIAVTFQWRDYIKARVNDDMVKHYFDENKEFFDGVAVRASHIVFRLAPNAPDAERQAARDKLLGLRQEIVTGKLDFAEAAKKYSQCPTAPKGGDLDFFPRKGMLEENFAKTAYATPVGQVSDIVQTDFGLHLIKVTDRKPGQPADFNKIKDEVRDFCVMELRQQLLVQLRKTAKVEIYLP
jgi:parvulin-like peptidyl-prolyl isomerase